MKKQLSSLYFSFIIIHILGICSLWLGVLSLISLIAFPIFNICFFTINIRVKKTRSATVSLILYLTFCICLFIIFVQIVQLDNYGNPDMPMPASSNYIFAVGAISLVISYIIVFIQMVKHFLKK